MNLYQIDDAILNCIDTETGDIVDLEQFENLEIARDKKISDTACFIKNLRAEAEAIKAEKKNLDARQKSAENLANRLEKYLSGYLNGETFKDARVAISYRKSIATQIAEDLDINSLPDEFKKVTVDVNKTAIKDALKKGVIIDGCMLVENTNIQIK